MSLRCTSCRSVCLGEEDSGGEILMMRSQQGNAQRATCSHSAEGCDVVEG